jgi:hypothetical protein
MTPPRLVKTARHTLSLSLMCIAFAASTAGAHADAGGCKARGNHYGHDCATPTSSSDANPLDPNTGAADHPAPGGAQGTPPPASPEGCHGWYTVGYKQATGNPAQGPAIVAETQSAAGRGGSLQEMLAAFCGVGSKVQ